MAVKTRNKANQDTYLACVMSFPLKAIKSARDHDEAVAVLARLSVRGCLDKGELDYAEALSKLIAEYESHHLERLKIRTRDPIEVLSFLMKEGGLSISTLGRIIGSQGVASEVLSGKRELSKSHIRKLAEHFRVDPGLFL